MEIFYICTSSDRYDQFKLLVPYKTRGIIVPRYLIKHEEYLFEEAVIYYKKLSKIYNCIVVFDYEMLEIKCLNSFPQENISSLYSLGLPNIEHILKIKGRTAHHKTILHVIFKLKTICKFAISSYVEGKIRNSLGRYDTTAQIIEQMGELFVPDGYMQTLGDMAIDERILHDSIRGVAEKFISLMSNMKLDCELAENIDKY